MSRARFTLDGLAKRMGGDALAEARNALKRQRKRIPAAARYAGFPDFCVRMGLPRPVAEFRFHPARKWRADFCWPEYRVTLEIEGAVWTNGGHSRGSGKVRDHEKFNACAALGYRVLYCQPSTLMTANTVQTIRSAINYQTEKQ